MHAPHLHSAHTGRRILPNGPLHQWRPLAFFHSFFPFHHFLPAFMKTRPSASYFSGICLPIHSFCFSSMCLSSPVSVLEEPRGLAWQPGTSSQDSLCTPWAAPPGNLETVSSLYGLCPCPVVGNELINWLFLRFSWISRYQKSKWNNLLGSRVVTSSNKDKEICLNSWLVQFEMQILNNVENSTTFLVNSTNFSFFERSDVRIPNDWLLIVFNLTRLVHFNSS